MSATVASDATDKLLTILCVESIVPPDLMTDSDTVADTPNVDDPGGDAAEPDVPVSLVVVTPLPRVAMRAFSAPVAVPL